MITDLALAIPSSKRSEVQSQAEILNEEEEGGGGEGGRGRKGERGRGRVGEEGRESDRERERAEENSHVRLSSQSPEYIVENRHNVFVFYFFITAKTPHERMLTELMSFFPFSPEILQR